MKFEIPVLVVGAGPTGLVLAHELARRGVPVRLIERAPTPARSARGVMLTARTLEILALMGLEREIGVVGRRVSHLALREGGAPPQCCGFGGLPTPFPFLLTLPQAETEHALTRALRRLGVAVEYGTTLVDLAPEPAGVVAQLTTGGGRSHAVRAGWVVGCDGVHSTVRHLLDFGLELGESDPKTVVLGDTLAIEGPAHDTLHLHAGPNGVLALVPLPGERWRVVVEGVARWKQRGRRRRIGDPEQPPTLEELQSLVAARGATGLRLTGLFWSAAFRFDGRAVSTLRQGRAFLAGEAARLCSPALGQGLNAGIEDAFDLAWRLALVVRGAAPESLLDSYAAGRLPAQVAAQRGLDGMATLPALPEPLLQRLRGLLPSGRPAPCAPVRAEILAASLAGIPLPTPASAGPQPGERAPDAPCLRLSDGRAVRVGELLADGRHVLLLVGYTGAEGAAQGLLARWSGAPWTDGARSAAQVPAEAGYGRARAAFVLSPDGRVALRGSLREVAARLPALVGG